MKIVMYFCDCCGRDIAFHRYEPRDGWNRNVLTVFGDKEICDECAAVAHSALHITDVHEYRSSDWVQPEDLLSHLTPETLSRLSLQISAKG